MIILRKTSIFIMLFNMMTVVVTQPTYVEDAKSESWLMKCEGDNVKIQNTLDQVIGVNAVLDGKQNQLKAELQRVVDENEELKSRNAVMELENTQLKIKCQSTDPVQPPRTEIHTTTTTARPENSGTPSVGSALDPPYEILANFTPSAGRVTDIFSGDNSILVSGLQGLSSYGVSTGAQATIQMPIQSGQGSSTVVTGDGSMWSVIFGYDTFTRDLYRIKSGGSWEKMNLNMEKPYNLAIDPYSSSLVVLDRGSWSSGGPYLRWVDYTQSPPQVTKTLTLPEEGVESPKILSASTFVIVESSEHCVVVMTIELETVQTLGQCGESGAGPGQLYYPSSVTVDQHGRYIIADTWNHRVSVFDTSGKHLFHVTGSDLEWVSVVMATNDGKLVIGTQIRPSGKVLILNWNTNTV